MKSPADGRRIKFTLHAKQRMEEFKIPFKEAIWMIHNSQKEKLPRDLRDAKFKRYGNEEGEIVHLRNGRVLFTVRYTEDKYTFEPILLVITVVDQIINLRY